METFQGATFLESACLHQASFLLCWEARHPQMKRSPSLLIDGFFFRPPHRKKGPEMSSGVAQGPGDPSYLHVFPHHPDSPVDSPS